MSDAERPSGPGVQQCPSCGSTAVLKALVEAGTVWFVCRHCDLRWSIADRRSLLSIAHDGPERRRLDHVLVKQTGGVGYPETIWRIPFPFGKFPFSW